MTILRRIAAVSFALLLTLTLLPTASQAQMTDGADTQAERVRTQISALLSSDNPNIQKQGINLVVHYAESNTVRTGDAFFRSKLYNLYTDIDRDVEVRLAALDALDAMGRTEDMATKLVQRLQTEPSAEVRQHTLRMLSKYNSMG